MFYKFKDDISLHYTGSRLIAQTVVYNIIFDTYRT